MLLQPNFTDAYERMFILGETIKEEEEKQGKLFVGRSGKLLNKMLKSAYSHRGKFFITDVFMSERPLNDDRMHFFASESDSKKEKIQVSKNLPKFNSRYIKQKYYDIEFKRLTLDLQEMQPNLIIALGATAMWATLGISTITRSRGEIYHSRYFDIDVLPTFHPSYVLRNPYLEEVVVEDFKKAIQYSKEIK